jgi:hypothetical protein
MGHSRPLLSLPPKPHTRNRNKHNQVLGPTDDQAPLALLFAAPCIFVHGGIFLRLTFGGTNGGGGDWIMKQEVGQGLGKVNSFKLTMQGSVP